MRPRVSYDWRLAEGLAIPVCGSITIDTHSAGNYDGRRVPRRSARNRAMDQLVWNQELGCNVLISTSVLDNGISLHADAVDHLVLCQPGKTSFLQMLGRVRDVKC